MFQICYDCEVILELLKSSLHLRELSRKTNITPSTLHRKINILIEENIIDLKEEGKNIKYFLKNTIEAKNAIIISEIYKRNKFYIENESLKLSLNKIIDLSEDKLLIVFGSYSKKMNTINSDIDVYIETKDVSIKKLIKNIDSRFNVKIGKFDKNSDLGKEIIKNHILLNNVERFYFLKNEEN